MKNSVQIFLKDQAVIHYEATVKKTTHIFVNVHELQEGNSPLFLVIEHQQTRFSCILTSFYRLSPNKP